ncbi:MAG: SbcC/MukB-like Walker B domain-containing protein, partial [Akkermansia sp.]
LETQAKALTEQGEEELSSQVTTLEQELKELRAQATTCSNALEQEAKAQATIADKREGIEAQQTQYAQWNRLSQLIGSADGKKYRNFAQGLTFEIMVQHANRQLIKMSKRYTLVRDEDEPLKLKVKDNYIDAEARSTDNLSGGERFIVSLALALGLSKMSSHKVRVDSLFLDEGFGTLDSEALEDATTALARLKEDGKLIGIISHVQALKDSIPMQINIANSGRKGRSTISGPGCSAMR